jgi:DNA-directed RNA polymerase specialized sigma24 family protein
MDEHDWLAERFRGALDPSARGRLPATRLRPVAYRVLGSLSEADDAVREAWLRLSRSDASEIENLGGWLARVVADGMPRAIKAPARIRTASGRRRSRIFGSERLRY